MKAVEWLIKESMGVVVDQWQNGIEAKRWRQWLMNARSLASDVPREESKWDAVEVYVVAVVEIGVEEQWLEWYENKFKKGKIVSHHGSFRVSINTSDFLS